MPNHAAPRQGDVHAMLRLMQPLDASDTSDPPLRKRRLLADLCRLIGNEVNGNGHAAAAPKGNGAANGHAHANGDGGDAAAQTVDAVLNAQRLSRRMEQTLRSLLGGAGEKQIAAKLGLSHHTVRVYVEALYKKYGMCSRGELLARWVKSES